MFLFYVSLFVTESYYIVGFEYYLAFMLGLRNATKLPLQGGQGVSKCSLVS